MLCMVYKNNGAHLGKNISREILKEKMKNTITTLNQEKNKIISPRMVEDEIVRAIKNIWKGEIVETKLSDWEKVTADKLLQEKYSTNEWNFQSLDNQGLMGACFVPSDSNIEEE